MTIIGRGAEAVLERVDWMGRDAVVKTRVPKGYRHPELDERIRRSRTKLEARLISEARKLGVPTPVILDVDLRGSALIQSHIDGPQLKALLMDADDEEAIMLCSTAGKQIARLHRGGLVHGDLTTSNMLVADGCLYFIDMSLGGKSSELEDQGVDLHLLKEAIESTHSTREGLFDAVVEGYLEEWPDGRAVIDKIDDIEARGRYK